MQQSSLLFNLNELRELEARRIVEDQTRRAEAIAARVQAAADAEAAACAALEAKARAERDEVVRLAAAQAAAAREERHKLEVLEAAERARHQAELEAVRQREELAIRRIEANQRRPKWMIAVTVLATIATIVLVVFTTRALASEEQSTSAAETARRERDKAIAMRDAAAKELVGLEGQLAALDRDVDAATRKLIDAETKAQRDQAARDIAKARADKLALEKAIREAKARKEREDRLRGVQNLCTGQAVCR